MSDVAAAYSGPATADDASGGIVCCSNDLCSAIPAARVPWLRLVVGLFVASQTMMLGLTVNLTAPDDRTTLLLLQGGMLAATLVVIALLGLPLGVEAARQLRHRHLTMELLFLAGISASMGISIWSMAQGSGPVYFEVVNVLLVIYAAGHAITSHSRAKALAAVQGMLNQVAQARMAEGPLRDVTLIRSGDRVRVMPGELVPVDGMVIDGQSLIRTTAFTGEWHSLTCRAGDTVLAGAACEDGTLLIEASATGLDRRIDRLAALITSACQSSSPLQRMADRFVRIFLPLVTATAAATLLYWGAIQHDWPAAIFNALAVVLVACPCAAGLAVPLATWTSISRLAEKGLLLKSADALQRLATVRAVTFDKTGTLADERLDLKELITAPDPQQRRRTLALLAAIERNSEHPVARALRGLPEARTADSIAVRAVRTLPGRGIEAEVILADRTSPARVQLVRREGAELLTIDASLDGLWIATASFTEALRGSSASAVEQLKAMGLRVQIMTGDSSGRAAAELAEVASGMTPESKHSAARAATANAVLFVGDGVNDAAAMAASHSSIALASGSQIAIETADATLHGGNLAIIPEAITLARRAMGTIRANFAWAVGYNLVGIALAVSGLLHPVAAAILMMVSSSVVAWRSFALAGKPIAPAASLPAAKPEPVQTAGRSLPAWLYATLHLIGLVGQGAIMIPLARLDWPGSLALLGGCAAVALLIIRYRTRLPTWADMTLAMLSLGGLGMNLGWWMDLHFSPAVQNGLVKSCCMVRKAMETAGPEAASHWMYWLMLLLGVPAMYLLRTGPIFLNWRRWCCTGMLLLGVPGMCFGMWAGAQLAMRLSDLSWQAQVLAAYLFMVLGMCAGMLVPHALELAWLPLRQRKGEFSATA